MVIEIWGKTIKIDDTLADGYRKNNNLDEAECRYLAKTSGATAESGANEIKKAIESGIMETIELESDMDAVIGQIRKRQEAPC